MTYVKLTILVDLSLVIITTYLEKRRRIFKKHINFTLFTPKITSPWVGGHEIYNLSPYPTDATYSE